MIDSPAFSLTAAVLFALAAISWAIPQVLQFSAGGGVNLLGIALVVAFTVLCAIYFAQYRRRRAAQSGDGS